VHVLHRDAEVEEIVNSAAIAVVDAQDTEARRCADGEAGGEVRAEEKPEAKIETVKQ
jgi:hypothetical protein